MSTRFRRQHDFWDRKEILEEYITYKDACQLAAHYERKYRGWTARIREWGARGTWYEWLGPRSVYRITMTRPKCGRVPFYVG